MKNTGIYKIKSIKTGRVYIGSTVDIKTRWSRHKKDLERGKHHSTFLQRHYNKYSIEDLNFTVLKYCKKEDLLIEEQYYLDNFSCEFNSCKIAGSCRGIKKSEAFKKKISELTKGKNNPTYGRERTKEWRNNISKANKGQKAWNKGLKNIYSEETLEKMRKPKAKKTCEYCGKQISPANHKRWHGENCKFKNKTNE